MMARHFLVGETTAHSLPSAALTQTPSACASLPLKLGVIHYDVTGGKKRQWI